MTTYDPKRRTERTSDEVVLFDMDGVILDGRGTEAAVHARALDDVLEERDLEVDDDLRGPLATYEYDDAFRAACGRIGVDPAEFFHAREERSAKRTVSRLAAGVRTLCPDVDALSDIAERATVGLVSNNYHPTVEFVVDHFRLTEFGYVRGRDLGPEGFERRKPDPYYLNETLDALDASGGLYVGDRATDVVAAERAGLEGVFLRREHNASLDLGVEPTAEIGSLHELADLLAPAGIADGERTR
ncbi:HAD family hydrolase [Halorubrum cibi]|uniref:Haloacid dehalogenase superfamily, subfamily IA, variant 1 with third motif having Dx(3-4)D or Dx(3-4)E n=1 Tax=Halorubrum cibi TaxID=413815 RepID=A0A521CDP6_9EURY|nr:HAD-IA family hydrolase [Halorubrum cibi]SMO57533.1 haloacid dehalogenase superfamily, subfamily IA, variant 1 with third motif having Dx(3-4)D or Dx(3-4)E [Halorubrum cibi]